MAKPNTALPYRLCPIEFISTIGAPDLVEDYGREFGPDFLRRRATTEGLREVVLCRDGTVEHRPVLGMLLVYHTHNTDDGHMTEHRDCVGQFRFDLTLEKLPIPEGTSLWILDAIYRDREPRRGVQWKYYVAEVLTREPVRGEFGWREKDGVWVEIEWGETLEWWVSRWHAFVQVKGTGLVLRYWREEGEGQDGDVSEIRSESDEHGSEEELQDWGWEEQNPGGGEEG